MKISILQALGMWLRKVSVTEMKAAAKLVNQYDLPATIDDVEAHYLAGGNVTQVLRAAGKAKQRGIAVDLMEFMTVDLSGEDIDEYVERGCVTRRDDLLQRSKHDSRAASELHKLLRDQLATPADDILADLEAHGLPEAALADLRRKEDEERVRSLRELAELEDQWPTLKHKS